MEEAEFIELNGQGLILGPDEGLERFEKRVQKCLQAAEDLNLNLKQSPPFLKALAKVKRLFDCEPRWVPLYLAQEKMRCWHGGAAVIEEELQADGSYLICRVSIEMRALAKVSTPLFYLYPLEEVLAHELAHVGRAHLDSKYEEIFAYMTSDSSFRRWLGPLFASDFSVLFTVSLSLLQCLAFALYLYAPPLFESTLSFFDSPLTVIALPTAVQVLYLFYLLLKLCRNHITLNQALNACSQAFGSRLKALHLLYRLNDREIEQLAALEPEQILCWVKKQKNELENKLEKDMENEPEKMSRRWQLLTKIYIES